MNKIDFRLLNLLFVLTYVSSCSVVKVDLDILNREKFVNSFEVTYLLTRDRIAGAERLLREDPYKSLLDQLDSRLSSLYGDLENDGTIQRGNAQQYLKQDMDTIRNDVTDGKKLLREGVSAFYEAINSELDAGKPKKLYELNKKLSDAENRFQNIEARLIKLTGGRIGGEDKTRELFRKFGITQLTTSFANPLIVEGDLIGDPIGSLAIFSDDEHWSSMDAAKKRKGKYSHAYAKSFFGNADVAITMEGIGHYSVKGIKMDASKITEVSFKVLGQSVNMIASLYGIKSTTTSTGAENQKSSASDIELKLSSEEIKASEFESNNRQALIDFLNVIMTVPNTLPNANDRTRAHSLLNVANDAFKKANKIDK